MLVDFDVLVWFTRGHPLAAARLRDIEPWRTSAATDIELAQGYRNKTDLDRLKRGRARRRTEIEPVTPTIRAGAMALIDTLALSHGLRLPDALIATTAVEQRATLLTGNAKHFEAVPDPTLEVFVA